MSDYPTRSAGLSLCPARGRHRGPPTETRPPGERSRRSRPATPASPGRWHAIANLATENRSPGERFPAGVGRRQSPRPARGAPWRTSLRKLAHLVSDLPAKPAWHTRLARPEARHRGLSLWELAHLVSEFQPSRPTAVARSASGAQSWTFLRKPTCLVSDFRRGRRTHSPRPAPVAGHCGRAISRRELAGHTHLARPVARHRGPRLGDWLTW